MPDKARWKKWLDAITPRSGRLRLESGGLINIGDVARKFKESINVFNTIRTSEYTPIVERKPTPGISLLRDRIIPAAAEGQVTTVGGEIQITTNATYPTIGLYSRKYGRYLPALIAIAGIRARYGIADTIRYGYGNDEGQRVMMEYDTTGAEPVYRTVVQSDGARWYEQDRSSWLDPLDGTGPSGLNIPDLSGATLRIYFGHYGGLSFLFYLAIGRRGIPGDDGDIEVFIDSSGPRANGITLAQPDLPVFIEVVNGTAYRGGSQFGVFGRYMPSYRRRASRPRTVSAGTDLVPIASMRIKDAAAWRGVPVILDQASAYGDTNGRYELIIGGTINNNEEINWTDFPGVSPNETALELNIAATTITGGYIADTDSIVAGVGNKNGQPSEDAPDLDLPRDLIVTLAVAAEAGTGSYTGVLKLREEF